MKKTLQRKTYLSSSSYKKKRKNILFCGEMTIWDMLNIFNNGFLKNQNLA